MKLMVCRKFIKIYCSSVAQLTDLHNIKIIINKIYQAKCNHHCQIRVALTLIIKRCSKIVI